LSFLSPSASDGGVDIGDSGVSHLSVFGGVLGGDGGESGGSVEGVLGGVSDAVHCLGSVGDVVN